VDKRRFAADDLKEISVCDGDGRTIILEAKNGVIEIGTESDEAFAIPLLESLAATPDHPVYEGEPTDIASPPASTSSAPSAASTKGPERPTTTSKTTAKESD
jgi:hypothetical protein